ncbi:TOBE domain-containing protein [Agrobacterium sp.]|uniref:TOBE domain-containing protein n=1 Tax=Agrobacterium sp. TaxID=361 RepID=UPI0039185194
MVGELAELIASLQLTAVYVTHDHAEALTLADEVAIMRSGHIEQLASPDSLIGSPATPEVADFLRLGGLADIEWKNGNWFLAGSTYQIADMQNPSRNRARILIPTRAVSADEGRASFQGVVLRSQFRGDGHLAVVSPPGLPSVELQLLSKVRFRPGETIPISVDADQIHWFGAYDQITQKERVATC